MSRPSHYLLAASAFGSLLAGASCGARTDLDLGGAGTRASTAPRCGDGIVDVGEACDDANDRDDDDCVGACVLATCGDGFVRAGFEVCDPGADAGCTAACARPTCGDGFVDPATEQCDGGPDCTPTCLFAACGDGIVQDGEECDGGPANEDGPAAYVVQGETIQGVSPFYPGVSQEAFYDYRSASSHTGLEALDQSQLFLVVDPGRADEVSLFTIHGIDRDGGGPAQGRCHVLQTFSDLPSGSYLAIEDDRREEFDFASATQVSGDWSFRDNTDGGVIGGLPWPGDYVVVITTQLERGITSWGVLDPTRERRVLEPGREALLVVSTRRTSCRSNCTIPRCNDGIVDAGEVCDDGNPDAGDGCAPDCMGP